MTDPTPQPPAEGSTLLAQLVTLARTRLAHNATAGELATLDAAQGAVMERDRQTERAEKAEWEAARLLKAASQQNYEVGNTLALALGYPRGPHPLICPLCEGECVQVQVCREQAEWGDHVAESLASEAAGQIVGLRAENERLRAALEFYADPISYEDAVFEARNDDLPVYTTGIVEDGGQRARAALAPAGNGEKP